MGCDTAWERGQVGIRSSINGVVDTKGGQLQSTRPSVISSLPMHVTEELSRVLHVARSHRAGSTTLQLTMFMGQNAEKRYKPKLRFNTKYKAFDTIQFKSLFTIPE